MKKIFSALILTLLVLVLVGCYEDKTKKNMELIEVRVYDTLGNEIIGKFISISNYYFDNPIEDDLENNVYRLNSAAPVENYYYVDVKENENYVIKFIFQTNNGSKLTKLEFETFYSYYDDKDTLECDDIEEVDGNFVATLNVTKTTIKDQYYRTAYWYNGEQKNQFHTMGSNIYNKGVCLLKREDKTINL